MAQVLTRDRIRALFEGHGAAWYGGEAVTQTEHALQCARLAERAGEPPAVILAALLHDVGHLTMAESQAVDMRHQDAGASALAGCVGEDVIEMVRLHVAAKRYLCAVDRDYWSGLSQASRDSLVLQGGPYDAIQAEAFAARPHARAAVRLRRYDDLAKVPGLATPPLGHYLEMLGGWKRAAVDGWGS